ncbi:MAG: hypothetical protein KDD44_08820 [Bdellovibrionales bacterium]|nr:hypothetical protein [Bdellovibrionales bacterium]
MKMKHVLIVLSGMLLIGALISCKGESRVEESTRVDAIEEKAPEERGVLRNYVETPLEKTREVNQRINDRQAEIDQQLGGNH